MLKTLYFQVNDTLTKEADTLPAYPRVRRRGYLSKNPRLDRRNTWKRSPRGEGLGRGRVMICIQTWRPHAVISRKRRAECGERPCVVSTPRRVPFHLPFVRGLKETENVKRSFGAFCLRVVCLMINQRDNWHKGGGWPLVGAAPKQSFPKSWKLHSYMFSLFSSR